MEHKPRVIASCNRKGGVGKTSLVFHLAGELARRGERVLLIDCDPQASLSQTFFGSIAVETCPSECTTAGLFRDDILPAAEQLIQQTSNEHICVVAANDALAPFALPEPESRGLLQDAILHLIHEVSEHFDWVLIDTPPNVLQLLSWAALVAADYVLTPIIPEDYAAQGLVGVRRFIEHVRATQNPEVKWLGLVLSMVQRAAVHKTYESQLREAYGELVFDTAIPHAVVFKESIAERTPITLYKPRTAAAKAVAKLMDEIIDRTTPAMMQEAA